MKFKIINTIYLSFIIASFGLTGCLKDKTYNDRLVQSVRTSGTQNILEIGLTSGSASNLINLAFPGISHDTTFDVPVVLASVNPASDDIHVTLSLNAAAVTSAGSYTVPNPSTYTILNNGIVTIPKGSHTGTLKVKFTPSNFAGGSWALGFTIKSVDKAGYTISGNLNTGIVAFQVMNQWDGDYISNGYLYHPSAARNITNLAKHGSTLSANSISMPLGDLGGSGYIAVFTINGTDVTITEAPGAAGAPYTMFTSGLPNSNPGYTAAWPGSASCNNTWDPVTKTFYVRYGYKGGTGWRVTEEQIKMQ